MKELEGVYIWNVFSIALTEELRQLLVHDRNS